VSGRVALVAQGLDLPAGLVLGEAPPLAEIVDRGQAAAGEHPDEGRGVDAGAEELRHQLAQDADAHPRVLVALHQMVVVARRPLQGDQAQPQPQHDRAQHQQALGD
jgi:hypothetical protein